MLEFDRNAISCNKTVSRHDDLSFSIFSRRKGTVILSLSRSLSRVSKAADTREADENVRRNRIIVLLKSAVLHACLASRFV